MHSDQPLLAAAAAAERVQHTGVFAALDRAQAVVEFDLDGRVVHANACFLDRMGYRADEVIGEHHRLFCTPEQAAGAECQAQWERLRRGEPVAGVFLRQDKRGRPLWWQSAYQPVLDAAGQPVGVVLLATDVTDARRQQLDLEGKMAAVQRVMAVVEFDLEGRVLFANEAFLAALGYALDDVVGQHHRLFCDPSEARSAAYQAFWQRLGKGQFDSGRYRRIAKTGRDVWIQASYNPVLDEAGRPVKVVKYATDITDEMRAAAEAEGKLEAIGRSQAVIEFDLNGNILTANRQFLRAMGYTLEEVQGRHHAMFCKPEHTKTKAYREFWADLAEGQYRSGRYERVGKHDAEVWIQATYNPILDADGKPFKVVKFAMEVGQQVERERAVSQKVTSISAVLDDMVRSIGNVARTTERTTDVAAQMQREAAQGSALLHRSREAIVDLRQSSDAVQQIVETIGEIAGQTHLLAFNAAIEAARAGEHGIGFSVVADEVRKLAEKSGEAARQIAKMVGQNVVKVAEGGRLSEDVDAAFQRIQEQVDRTSRAVSDIHEAMTQQAAATTDVSGLLQALQREASA